MNRRLILEKLLKFAFDKDRYDLEHDDFAEFGEEIWEIIEIEDIKRMFMELEGESLESINKMIDELKSIYEEDIEE